MSKNKGFTKLINLLNKIKKDTINVLSEMIKTCKKINIEFQRKPYSIVSFVLFYLLIILFILQYKNGIYFITSVLFMPYGVGSYARNLLFVVCYYFVFEPFHRHVYILLVIMFSLFLIWFLFAKLLSVAILNLKKYIYNELFVSNVIAIQQKICNIKLKKII